MILAQMWTASGSEIGLKFWPREGQSSDFNVGQAEFCFFFIARACFDLTL